MNAIFSILNPNNTVTINRPLAHAIGLNEAVIYGALLSKCQYYAENDMLFDGEWFYSTAADLYESTALSEKQQKRCIDRLVDFGLIECRKMGMPAKRYFCITDDISVLEGLLARGAETISEIKLACSDQTSEQVPTKGQNKSLQNVGTSSDKREEHIYKTKENKSKESNPKSSIYPSAESSDGETDGRTIHTTEVVDYPAVIRANIDYDWFYENRRIAGLGIDMPKVNEIYSIMCDIVCSNRPTIRVNGEEMSAERVKQRFLQLNGAHIEYVIDAMKNNPNEIRNIRAYWITALYNSPATMDSYYGEAEKRDGKL